MFDRHIQTYAFGRRSMEEDTPNGLFWQGVERVKSGDMDWEFVVLFGYRNWERRRVGEPLSARAQAFFKTSSENYRYAFFQLEQTQIYFRV